MAALLVGMAIMAVMMTMAMPVWSRIAQREKEEELVFRGEQYARAIALYQRKFANAAPPTIDLLLEQKFLRKKYKDPITNDDFVPISQGQMQVPQAQNPQGRNRQRGAPPQQSPQAQRPGVGSQAGGLVGVTSKSTAESIRLYKGRNHYNEWQFVYTPQAPAPGGGQNPQNPGQQPGPAPSGQRQTGPGPFGRGSDPRTVSPQIQPPGPRPPGR